MSFQPYLTATVLLIRASSAVTAGLTLPGPTLSATHPDLPGWIFSTLPALAELGNNGPLQCSGVDPKWFLTKIFINLAIPPWAKACQLEGRVFATFSGTECNRWGGGSVFAAVMARHYSPERPSVRLFR